MSAAADKMAEARVAVASIAVFMANGKPLRAVESAKLALQILEELHEAEKAQPAPEPTSERVAFEAWIAKDCGDLSTFGSGQNIHYKNSAVNNAWTGWKARAGRADAQPADREDAEPLAPIQLDAAAKKLAELFDYPWDHMPAKGRQTMRNNVIAVLEAIGAARAEKGGT